MRQSNRLIINMLSMFGRMAFTVGIGLLVTRLLLRWLGEVDFGLILALAATGSMLQFVTGALTSSVQRHLAYEIGRKDAERLNRVFSTAWAMFYIVGIGLWIIGQLLAPLILRVLDIPADRLDASWWVYQFSLLNLVIGVTATPFLAAIVAYQHLTAQAVFDALSMLSRLLAVLFLLVVPWDRMVTYVGLQLAGYAVVRWMTVAYCYWKFPAIRPSWRRFDSTEVKRIMHLAGWSVLADLAWRLRMQGGTLLLNIFFGPRVNAGYGISVQLAGYVSSFTQAIRLSVLPAIVGAQAQDNRQNVHRLALVAGKYALLLLSLLFVPVWIAMPEVLRLWLGDLPLPPYTIVLSRIVLIWALADIFTVGYSLALLGTGDIGWLARLTVYVSAAVVAGAAFGFWCGAPPWLLPLCTCAGVLVLGLIRVFGIGAQIHLPPSRWVCEALLPTLAVLLPATAVAAAVYWSLPNWPMPNWMPDGLVRLVATGVAYGVVGVPLIWWVGLAAWEREKFLSFGRAVVARLPRAG
jgi:O-antigen/teichoic acid export membrane protein